MDPIQMLMSLLGGGGQSASGPPMDIQGARARPGMPLGGNGMSATGQPLSGPPPGPPLPDTGGGPMGMAAPVVPVERGPEMGPPGMSPGMPPQGPAMGGQMGGGDGGGQGIEQLLPIMAQMGVQAFNWQGQAFIQDPSSPMGYRPAGPPSPDPALYDRNMAQGAPPATGAPMDLLAGSQRVRPRMIG